MISLTRIDRKSYEVLLKESRMRIEDFADKYGVGWPMRMQGVLCAMTVHDCAKESRRTGHAYETADELYDLVREYGFDEIFEENGMESLKPKEPLLGMMLFSMCQAETGDYGGE